MNYTLQILDALGIPPQTKLNGGIVAEELVSLFLEGYTSSEIGEKYSCSRRTVSAANKKLGLSRQVTRRGLLKEIGLDWCSKGHVAEEVAGGYCKDCRKEYDKQYHIDNSEAIKEYHKEYQQNNKEALKEYRKEYHQRPEVKKQKRAHSAKRRASELQRTPPWADFLAIQEFYAHCPEGHHVDHIIPLQGEKVSGLHTLENLQYLTAEENLSKGNKFLT